MYLSNFVYKSIVCIFSGRSVDLTNLGLANSSTTEQSKINHCNDTTEFLCAASHLCIPKYWLCDEKVMFSRCN